jgi:hypothetical protein
VTDQPHDLAEYERHFAHDRRDIVRRYELWRADLGEAAARQLLREDTGYLDEEVAKRFRQAQFTEIHQPEFTQTMWLFHDVILAERDARRELLATLAAADAVRGALGLGTREATTCDELPARQANSARYSSQRSTAVPDA